jgi:hypothetical protein
MKHWFWMALIAGCGGKTDATSTADGADDTDTGSTGDVIIVDGMSYELTLTPVLPDDQANLFSDIDALALVVTQGDGTQSTHDLWGGGDSSTGTASDVPFLVDAVLALAGSSGSDLILYGETAPITVFEGTVNARIAVARVDAMAQIAALEVGTSFAPVVAAGAGQFFLFGGAPGGARDQDPSIDIYALDLGVPGSKLLFKDTGTDMPALSDSVTPRMGHSATAIGSTGQVLVAGGIHRYMPLLDGGYIWNGEATTTGDAFLFDPETRGIEEIPDLTNARSGHVAIENDLGELLMIGGFLNSSGSSSFSVPYIDIFDPASATFEQGPDFLGTGAAMHAAANLPGEGVLVCGGIDYAYNFVAECTLINSAHTHVEVAGPGKKLVAPAMTTLADGRVLLTGGLDGSDSEFSFNIFSNSLDAVTSAFVFEDGGWRSVGEMRNPRAWHTAIPLPDGTVLIAGGVSDVTGDVDLGPGSTDGSGVMFHPASAMACAEIFDPASETFTEVDLCTDATEASTLPARAFLQASAVDPAHGALLVGGIGAGGEAVGSVSLYRTKPDL